MANEYINKAELMDEFYGALKVPVKGKDDKMGWLAMSADYVYDITNDMPTIKIVRCKDCECFRTSGQDGGVEYCEELLREVHGNWFCADGERRIDE